MKSKIFTSHLVIKEIAFQILLNMVVFIFFAYDKRIESIDFVQVYFYLNYAVASLLINYVFLKHFLYKNHYIKFLICVLLTIGIVIVFEEMFLEKLFFPDTRGRKFSKMFYNLMSTLPTLTILIGFKFAWDALIKQQEVLELKNSIKESELQFLKSQINPHFLFNNMNNLYSYAIEESPKTPELILEFSSVLRYMLYECKARFVPLKKEIEHLENYINLSRLQIEGRGTVEFEIEKFPIGLQIAPLILTVFVENAFKHSASSQLNDIDIIVKLEVNAQGELFFFCKNTFLEQSNTDNLDKGIGLENVKKRLELIYPNSNKLQIRTEKNYYIVELSIELHRNSEI